MGAITATLVYAGHNRLRYQLEASTTGVDTATITTTGAATPDILTDVLPNQGPICALAKAYTDGYGRFAAGGLNQAQARALWASDLFSSNPSTAPGIQVPTARMRLIAEQGEGQWFVDANVAGGHPIISASCNGVGEGGLAFLDIEIYGAIGA